MKRLNGFTLAEVLIALAIIGVIAALTVPSVMQDTTGKKYKVALKKGISTLNQAVLRSVAIDGKDFGDVENKLDILRDNLRDVESFEEVETACGTSGIVLADGMMVAEYESGEFCIDVNGAAGPNKLSKDEGDYKDGYILHASGDSVICGDDYCRNIMKGIDK